MTDAGQLQLGLGKDVALKVLLVDTSDRGGIATYTAHLRRALSDEGAEVLLAAPVGFGDEGSVLSSPHWGPEFARLGRLARYRLLLADLVPSVTTLLRSITRTRPDIVHVQTKVVPGFDHLALRMISRRVPVVITAHDPISQDGGTKDLADQARRWRT